MAISYPAIKAGLTNQKIAIIGLIHKALRDKKSLTLPSLTSYYPETRKHDFCSFEKIYKEATLERALSAFGLSSVAEPEPEMTDSGQCFLEGADRWAETALKGQVEWPDLTCQIIRHLQPSDLLLDFCRLLLQKIKAEGITHAIQLRVENDWQSYAEHVLASFAAPHEEYKPTFLEIIQKAKRTWGNTFTKAYVLSDEGGLPADKETIRAEVLKELGVELFWKSDFLSPSILSSNLISSIIDFEIALALPFFAGNSRSTFACFVSFEKFCRTGRYAKNHYIYNNSGPHLMLRYDNGALMAPEQLKDALFARQPLLEVSPYDREWALTLTAHLAQTGDFISRTQFVMGVPSGHLVIDGSSDPLRSIEGFQLDVNSPLPSLEYRARNKEGRHTPWQPAGSFCGSRGKNAPLTGFSFRIKGPASLTTDCIYAARFSEHSEVIHAKNGEWCTLGNDHNLTAIHLLFRPQKPFGR
ncbi:O-fucosyltransferase family protein [Acetobacter thailandicus]|uniref:Uncharacterized protein n=1 Tax=Acetobacter thailandicus TaxID=1502842 RepID=A0ABT3QB84_9PROT|nr:hypothetical protein [Acetobacter thailandicus]MBS0959270.1 hypothetical protein [Acetobacter thailandicus]MBS0984833.1 hypothetical protein [Acetobacter thailandicus]MCX2562547.1 hypothetical protein [Acetobacter thailandicus]NHN94613.1 hypothetical protein [Acetobacter thailandicus]